MILVDSSVVLDLVLNDSRWSGWSQSMLDAAGAGEEFAINDVIYAEVSIGYDDPADLDTMMSVWQLRMVPTPRSALFGAGKAWRQYRSNGGIRTGVLPDFSSARTHLPKAGRF